MGRQETEGSLVGRLLHMLGNRETLGPEEEKEHAALWISVE